MTEFEDDPRVGQAFDRLREDAQTLDAMAPLNAVKARRRTVSRLALGLVGGVAVALLVVIGVSIWGDDEDEQIAADGGISATVEGTFWELVEGRGPDGPITVFEGRRVTLEFRDGTAGGRGPCNSYGGDLSIRQESITITNVAQTEEGCGADVDSAEAAYVAAFTAADTIKIEGNQLVLSGAESELRYRPSEPDPPDPNVLTIDALDGTAWTLVDSWAPQGPPPVPLVDGWPITLTFDGDSLGGTAACNGYGGQFSLSGPGPLVSQLSWTEMGCEPTVMASESAYLEMLGAVEGGRFQDGQLVLSSELGELFFALEAPVPTADLVGQVWLLDTLIQGEAASSVMGDPATLLLGEDGTIEGGTGCRTLSGEYVVSGASVLLTTFAAEGDCSAGLRAQDSAVITVLEGGFSAQIDGQRLTLSAAGNEGLSYVAVDEAPDFEPAPALTIEELDGTSWRLVEGAGPEGPIESGERAITLTFAGARVDGQAPCNGFSAEVEIADAAFSVANLSRNLAACAEIEIEERFLAAFEAAERIQLFGTYANAGELVLTGPEIDMLFESTAAPIEGSEGVTDEPLTIGELLDLRPDGPVDVAGLIGIPPDGTVLLCEDIDDARPAMCGGRWVVVTNYNSLVDTGDSFRGELLDDGRFAIVGPGSGVLERPTVVEVTAEDAAIAEGLTGPQPDLGAFAWADEVELWLGVGIVETRMATEMLDPASWVFAVEDFEGFAGPFDVLGIMSGREVQVLVGPHNHCAGLPILLPGSLWGLRQVSIQPTGIDSCIDWFSVDVFVNDAGEIEAVMLDLFGP